MTKIKTIIFDLDGTLIDSSASILAGFAGAFAGEGVTPTQPLVQEIIGPPLKDTLAILAGSRDSSLIDRLAERFKQHYDTAGYRATTVFDGVPEMLRALHGGAKTLHIATNKRLHPTLKILDHLGWSGLFGQVKALDAWSPPAVNKAEMIRRLMAEERIAPDTALYVGDREEDFSAATANGLAFALAAWGYGGAPEIAGCLRLDTPAALLVASLAERRLT
jgi:phosphoglycolate phosphatase